MSGSLDTSDILVVIDTGDNLSVNLQPPDQYAVSITAGDTYVVNLDLPSTIVSTQADSFYRVADFAVTASYISGASNSWDGLLGKPEGLISSSTQVNYTQLQNIPVGIISSSTQVNYTDIQNKPTLIASASYAQNAVSASFALTASYVSGSVSSWDTLTNKPPGLVSSSVQALGWTVESASFASKVRGVVETSQLSVLTNAPTTATVISSSVKSGIFAATEIIDPPFSSIQHSGVSVEYVAQRTGALRAGALYATWSGSSISYTDVSNTGVGDTSDLSFNFIRVGDNILLRAYSAGLGSGAWTIQCLFKMFSNVT
jgi:hypothetical protein